MRSKLMKTSAFALAGLVLQACQATEPVAVAEVAPVAEKVSMPVSADPEIADLIAQMTLDEKLAQLSCIWTTRVRSWTRMETSLRKKWRPIILMALDALRARKIQWGWKTPKNVKT